MYLYFKDKLYAPIEGGWQPCNIIGGKIITLTGKQFKPIKSSEYQDGQLLTLYELSAKFNIYQEDYYFDKSTSSSSDVEVTTTVE